MGFASDLTEQRERQRRRSVADPYGVTAEEYDRMYPGTLRAEALSNETPPEPDSDPEYKPTESTIGENMQAQADKEADERQKLLEAEAKKRLVQGIIAGLVGGPAGWAYLASSGVQVTNQSIANARKAKGRQLSTSEWRDAADPLTHLGANKTWKKFGKYTGPGLAYETDKLFGGNFNHEVAKFAQGLVSGKGTDQLGRDYFRRAMQRAGLADREFNVRFGDGESFNIGKGGALSNYGTENVWDKNNEYSDRLVQKGDRKIFQIDPTDPYAAKLTAIADPLSRILAQNIPAGGSSYKDDIAGTFYNLMRQTGDNPHLRMRGVWQKLGFDEAGKAHAALDGVEGLSDWEKTVMHGSIDRTYSGATDSGVHQKYGEGWIEPIHRDAYIADAQKRGVTGPALDEEGYVIEENDPRFKYRKGRGVVW